MGFRSGIGTARNPTKTLRAYAVQSWRRLAQTGVQGDILTGEVSPWLSFPPLVSASDLEAVPDGGLS